MLVQLISGTTSGAGLLMSHVYSVDLRTQYAWSQVHLVQTEFLSLVQGELLDNHILDIGAFEEAYTSIHTY